jgi:DNA-binding CsgD family transcriptional regulator
VLRGRATEQAAIEALLAGAAGGASAALVVRGEPGVGKTALLDDAAARSGAMGGLRVLRAAGVESEARLPFAGLHLLLGPALDGLPALPAPQRHALSAALGLAEAERGRDRFVVGAAVLSLLAEAAPLLCLVDDAHWLDRESAEALLFAARRLGREGVVILFAARDQPAPFGQSELPELRLAGLDTASAAALLDDSGATLSPAERDRLIAETGGNPLALRELPSVAATRRSQLDPLPLTSRVLDAYHGQVRALPARTQALLLLAAADDAADLALLVRAGTRVGAGLDDLRPAETAGLVAARGDTLAFRHPLVRAAAYQGAPLTDRIAAHAAWAAAHKERGDADRRAWHLAAAALGPDEAVARELEQAAGRAAGRAGHAAAAAAYERAAQLSQDPADAVRRQVLACEAAVAAGQLPWAAARARRVAAGVTDPELRARLTEVRAAAGFAHGELRDAYTLLTGDAALVSRTAPERGFWMLMRAFHAVWAAPTDRPLMLDAVDRFGALDLEPGGGLAALRTLVRWCAAAGLGLSTAGLPPVDEVLPRAVAAGRDLGPQALVEVASRALVLGRESVTVEVAAELVARAREEGTVGALPAGLGFLTMGQALLGLHRDARVSGAEAMRIARDTGQRLWVSYAASALAHVAAAEGDERECRSRGADALLEDDANAPAASLAGATTAQTALALLDLGHGRVQAAFDRLLAVARGATGHQSAVVRCVPDLVEAAVRLGRAGEVAEPLAAYTVWARTLRQPWIDALLARCRALTAPDEQAEQHYKDALARHEEVARPFERARTELLYGEWLRRVRRRSDARGHLEAAQRAFQAMGCTPWADRAGAELGATGAAGPTAGARSDVELAAALTPQELQISRLAAQGLSNRDIAAQLYLSPRTVAYHLYKAYPKLGIASRGELAGVLRPAR